MSNTWKSLVIVSVLLTLAFVYALLTQISFDDGLLHIYVLDIGQGDSILIKSPDGHLGLIDGGKGSSVLYELAEVMPPLVRQLDFVLATHPDADHIEGLVEVLTRYEVKQLFWQKNEKQSAVYEKLKSLVALKNIPNFELRDSDEFSLGCCTHFDVVWPLDGEDIYHVEANDISLSVIMTYGELDVFLGGDLSVAQEEKIWELLPLDSRDIDILKVSHHGSKTSTSSSFLELSQPEVGLISIGEDNSYGHPASSVMESMSSDNVHIFRTDRDGRIDVSSDGKEFIEISREFGLENLELKL